MLAKFSQPTIITESVYFANSNSDLKSMECPCCTEIGGLFVGLSFIQCRKCFGLFTTFNELMKSLSNNKILAEST